MDSSSMLLDKFQDYQVDLFSQTNFVGKKV